MYTYLIIICIRIYILNFTTRRGKTPGGNVQRDFSKKVCKFFEFVAKLFGFESFFQDGPVFGRIFWWLSSSEPYENKSRTQTGPRFEMVNSKNWSFGRLLIGQYTELHCRSWSSSSLTCWLKRASSVKRGSEALKFQGKTLENVKIYKCSGDTSKKKKVKKMSKNLQRVGSSSKFGPFQGPKLFFLRSVSFALIIWKKFSKFSQGWDLFILFKIKIYQNFEFSWNFCSIVYKLLYWSTQLIFQEYFWVVSYG